MKRIEFLVTFFLVVVFTLQVTAGAFAAEKEQGYYQETIITASILSLLVPGLGHYLLKINDRALTHFLVCIGAWVVGVLLIDSTYGISIILPIIWHVYSAFDVFAIASSKGIKY